MKRLLHKFEKLKSEVEKEIKNRESSYNEKTENWKHSVKGLHYLEDTQMLKGVFLDLKDNIEKIKGNYI
jgi:uncharacterized protein YdcH (DUF465 family)